MLSQHSVNMGSKTANQSGVFVSLADLEIKKAASTSYFGAQSFPGLS